MAISLAERRLDAAIASKGTSSDVVYDLVVKLMRHYDVKGSLLEFGAGTGTLIQTLRDAGYKGTISGADILPKPVSLPSLVPWFHGDLNDPVNVAAESFDVIVSTEVIEHLENPRGVFREFNRVLRNEGMLILTTTNQESIRSLLSVVFLGHFVAFLDSAYPAHITPLLRTDFSRIASETGFAPPQFHFSDVGGLPKLPRVTWQKFAPGLLTGRLFSDNIALMTKKIRDVDTRIHSVE